MRRILTKIMRSKMSYAAIAAVAMLLFVVPHMAHAQILPVWLDTPTTLVGNIVTSFIEVLILPLASGILALAGIMLDLTIRFSLNTAYIFSLSPAINLGWTIIRDMANIFFIFIMIWISLGTIVNGLRFGTSSALKNVIIAAILINFSLFITKAVIDVSNVFGQWMYYGVERSLSGDVTGATSGQNSISALITQRMGLMDLDKGDPKALNDPSQSFTGRMLRLAVVLIAIYIFIYAAVLFLARSIELLFLLVFSPVGFMGKVLPQIDDYAKEWRSELTSVALFPIVFLIMLYISIQFINTVDHIGGGTKFLDASNLSGGGASIPGTSFTVGQYFMYFLIIFLLGATLKVAKKYSGELGKSMGGMAESLGKLAVSAVGTYATGGATMMIRAAGRGAGAYLSAEKGKGAQEFKKTFAGNLPPIFTGNGKIGQYYQTAKEGGTGALIKRAGKDAKEATTNKMKSGTWDVRNVGIGENTAGSAMTSIVGSAGMKGVDLKGKDAKALKAEQAEWNEEKKIQKASLAILTELDKIAKKQLELDALKTDLERRGVAPESDEYRNALRPINENINASKIAISDQAQGLGNKQLEKLDKKAIKNPEFIRTISQGQAEHLAEKAENDEDKAKVWGARLSDVKGAMESSATGKARQDAIKKTIKAHSDKELENLDAKTLRDPDFTKPDVMDYDTFSNLMKNTKLAFATKNEMRNNRYIDLDAAIDANDPTRIAEQLKTLDESEIAKLGWKKDGKDNTRLSNPEVIKRLPPKVLGKLFDELDEVQRQKIKDVFAQNNVTPPGSGIVDPLQKNLDAVGKWFRDNNIGQQF